jgi:YD repeat-containing protein
LRSPVWWLATTALTSYTFLYDTDARTATAIDSYDGVSHFRYDEQHREIARHDPNGGVTITEYDEHGTGSPSPIPNCAAPCTPTMPTAI